MTAHNSQQTFLEMLYRIQDHIRENLYHGDFNYEGSLNTLQKHLDTAQQLNIPNLAGRTVSMCGIIELERNNYAAAEEHFLQARAYFEESGNTRRVGTTYLNTGEVMRRWGKLESAAEYYAHAREVIESINDGELLVFIANNEGMLWVNGKQPDRALPYLEKALEHASKMMPMTTRVKELLPEALDGMARAYMQLEKYDKALDYAQQSLERAVEVAVIDKMASANQTLARLAMLTPERDDEVVKYLDESERHWRRFHSPVELGDFLTLKGDYYKGHDANVARQAYEEALECYHQAERTGKAETLQNRLSVLQEGQ